MGYSQEVAFSSIIPTLFLSHMMGEALHREAAKILGQRRGYFKRLHFLFSFSSSTHSPVG